MYLYEQNGDNILIYEMTLNERKARVYREKMIRKTTPDNHVYRAITSRDGLLLTERAVSWDLITSGHYHIMEKYKDSALIQQYINGEFKSNKIIQVMNDGSWGYKYLLLTDNFYKIENKEEGIKIMSGIISIPHSLYVLQLLEKGEFSKIYDGKKAISIEQQLEVFNISKEPIDQFNISRIQRAQQLGIISEDNINYHNPNGLLATSKILQKVKEKQ